MSRQITHITDDTLDAEVLAAAQPVLLDFWADWCGPCKNLMPILDDLADDYAGEVQVSKINADENPKTSERFNVRGLPTLILFRNGKEYDRLVGVQSKTRLANALDKCLES